MYLTSMRSWRTCPPSPAAGRRAPRRLSRRAPPPRCWRPAREPRPRPAPMRRPPPPGRPGRPACTAETLKGSRNRGLGRKLVSLTSGLVYYKEDPRLKRGRHVAVARVCKDRRCSRNAERTCEQPSGGWHSVRPQTAASAQVLCPRLAECRAPCAAALRTSPATPACHRRQGSGSEASAMMCKLPVSPLHLALSMRLHKRAVTLPTSACTVLPLPVLTAWRNALGAGVCMARIWT